MRLPSLLVQSAGMGSRAVRVLGRSAVGWLGSRRELPTVAGVQRDAPAPPGAVCTACNDDPPPTDGGACHDVGWQCTPGVLPGELDCPPRNNGYPSGSPLPTRNGSASASMRRPLPILPTLERPNPWAACAYRSSRRVAQMARFDAPGGSEDGRLPVWISRRRRGRPARERRRFRMIPSISPTPVSGSCCGAAQLCKLTTDAAMGGQHRQAIPGVALPDVVYAPDGWARPSSGPERRRRADPAARVPWCATQPSNCGSSLACASRLAAGVVERRRVGVRGGERAGRRRLPVPARRPAA